jgi:alpha-amylase
VAENLVIYCVAHQPRRLRLPAQVIPAGTTPEAMAGYLFDDEMNQRYLEKVAHWCYHPATEMFAQMLEAGFKLSLGFSLSLLWQVEQWDPVLADRFRRLVGHTNCELVGVEPYHGFSFALDIRLFQEEMLRGRTYAQDFFGKPIAVTDTTEMVMNNEIYYALAGADYKAGMLDGRPWVMEWREPTHLYQHGGRDLALFCRHHQLSDDVGYRFSNRSWPGFPLRAEAYATDIRKAWGDFAFIGWDFETFGEHHNVDTGIFDFMRALPGELVKQGVSCLLPSEAVQRFGQAELPDLPLPEFGTTWAGSGGLEFFLGNPSQQAIFRLMHSVLGKARLTGNQTLLDLALWLLQSDNLHLIQWAGRSGPEAEVSAYFTPDEWWDLGPDKILTEQQRVYTNFVRAMDAYV